MKKMIVCFAAAGAIMAACGGAKERTAVVADDAAVVEFRDFGAEPTVIDIERYTLANDNFRTALWTGGNLQLTLMSIPAGGEVGLECHDGIDQFLRVESGCGRVEMGDSRERLDFVREAGEDFAIIVPAGKWHNITNTGDEPLKVYSIYAPAEHAHGTVHRTYEEAMQAEAEHGHAVVM